MFNYNFQYLWKRLFFLYLIIFHFIYCESGLNNKQNTLFEYSLKEIIEVDGRQGIATDGQYYVVSGSKELYLYTIKGKLLKRNSTPFKKLSVKANHLGDIAIYKDEIFTGVENFVNGRGENIQIVIYNLDDLKYKRSIPWDPSSGQVEVCGIAVDEKRNLIWLADWVNGQYLYRYGLKTGKYIGRLMINPAPDKIQGISVYGDHILLTSDDGDADKNKHDRLYSIKIPNSNYGAGSDTKFEKLFDEFVKAGEIEGLCFFPNGRILSVLMNRGRRINQGIPEGFYPGYNREIHEVYVYNINK
jgi:hypothetical protein|tara:strand:+ start:6153 stop:7055 length:903 start_codon:yes stop_codon:yes gene_type:complete